MQWMHQSYKCMKAQQKKQSGCASNLLAHEDLGQFEDAVVGIYKPSSIIKNSRQYMKVTTQETLYHEDHGATLKHKCGKKDSSIAPSLFFSHFFIWAFSLFFMASFFLLFLFFYFSSGVSSRLVGESQYPLSFPHLGNALIMMIITLLFTYNSKLEQNMTLYCISWYTAGCIHIESYFVLSIEL